MQTATKALLSPIRTGTFSMRRYGGRIGSMATKASITRKSRVNEMEETRDIHTYGLDH